MKYVSLFAGIGGFDLALNRLGHECVYANEWDKYSAQTYEKNFGHKPDTTDITTVATSDIPDHDLLVGGFPCQAFSIAGKRKGFDDTRGTLFFDIARIAKAKRPKYLLLENVKGLLSHDSGRTFKTILSTLTELGYDLQTMVLNSKNFGVPQNRERVFIVGHSRNLARPKVFPLGANSQQNKNELQELTTGVSDAMRVYNIGQVNKGMSGQVDSPLGIARTLKGLGGGLGAKTGLYVVRQPLKFLQRNQKNIKGDYAFTVDGANTGGVRQDMKIRRLTPLECLRLQGFPDNWFDVPGLSDTQKYKQAGNAVTVNVVYEVAKLL